LACQGKVSSQEAAIETDEAIPGAYPEDAVLLNFNENPLGPSPKALSAILEHGLTGANRYNNIFPLMGTLARHHEIAEKNLLLGCGSTEFLHIAPWTFLKEGHSLVLPDPSYGWSAGVAASMGADIVRVPLLQDGSLDVAQFSKALDAKTRLVYIANPNNPTGAALTLDEVNAIVEALPDDAVLFVDEAYSQFLTREETSIDLVKKGAPVIVARTFSKAFGLAGLRLGYAIAPEEVTEKLKTYWLWDLGINAAVNVAAPAALTDTEHVTSYTRTVDEGLEYLRTGLKELGFASMPHRAPFFMVDLKREAKPVVAALEQKKVYVRDGKAWNKPTFLRISVGRPTENQACLDAIRQVLA
jgi:histidinol-phosphate aminotransferase